MFTQSINNDVRSLVCVFGLLLALTACNTLEGAGEDVQKAGEKIEDVAK